MPRSTLAQFKLEFNWPQFLGLSPSDPRWLLLLNETLQRFMASGDLWVGKVQRYRFCAPSACITIPRQFDTVEVTDICDRPYTIRNQWFEFLDNGPGGARLRDCCSSNVFDRGRGYVMFDDVLVASRIRLYHQYASDVGAVVNLRGWDSTGNEVLTDDGDTVGENMTLGAGSLPFVDSATIWMPQVFRQLIKPVTKGYVRAYSWDASKPTPPASPSSIDTPLHPLAAWEPSETIPDYRRYFVPAVSVPGSCCGGHPVVISDPPTPTTARKPVVTIMAKMAYVPIVSDLDILPLTCTTALKLGMLALMKQERGDTAGAQAAMNGTYDPVMKRYVDGAIPLLDEELAGFQGAGTVQPLRLESAAIDRAYVPTLI